MTKIRISEYLDVDLENENWLCNRCGFELFTARDSYMKGCLVYERPAGEIYGPPYLVVGNESISYAPDPDFMRILEFYCSECGTMIEVQYLPPGHPIPRDVELDIDKLKEKNLE